MTSNQTWLQRFYNKVDTSGECWFWRGARVRGEYGVFGFPDKIRTAHRGLWDFVVGVVPEGYELDHLCRNPGCVRLDHLEMVTRKVNMQRSQPYRELTAFAATNAAKEICNAGHPLEGDNVYQIPGRKSGRYCRTCHAERSQEWAKKKQAERIANGLPTHCKNGHEYVEGSFYVRSDRPNSRYCRQCQRDLMVGNTHARKSP